MTWSRNAYGFYTNFLYCYTGSFNRDARNLLDHSSYVVKETSVKFVVNCLVWQITMEGHSVEQRVQIIKFYYQNQCSVRETFRALHDFYPRHNHPAESIIRRLVAKFESTGSINNQPTSVRRRNANLLKTSLLCVRVYGRGGQFSSFTRIWPFCDFNLVNFASGLGSAPLKFKLSSWPRNLR